MSAFSTKKLCGPCEARYNTTTATSWCMECDDGHCSLCLVDHKVNKASKNHQTIPVSQYVEIESVSSLIKQECDEHDQRNFIALIITSQRVPYVYRKNMNNAPDSNLLKNWPVILKRRQNCFRLKERSRS